MTSAAADFDDFDDPFVLDHEARGEGLVRDVIEISAHPGHPMRGSKYLFSYSARRAFEDAAAEAPQPRLPEGWVS